MASVVLVVFVTDVLDWVWDMAGGFLVVVNGVLVPAVLDCVLVDVVSEVLVSVCVVGIALV